MKEIGIFGAQGFAREVADVALCCGYRPYFIVQSENDAESLKSSDFILETNITKHNFGAYAIGIGDNLVRMKIAQIYAKDFYFPNLVHPDTSFGLYHTTSLDALQGTIICAGVRLTNRIQLGNFNILNLNVTIGHDCIINDFVSVAPGANISGNVIVEKGAYIGTGASILQGQPNSPLFIRQQTIIGGGAVVVEDCDSFSVYTGIPARKNK